MPSRSVHRSQHYSLLFRWRLWFTSLFLLETFSKIGIQKSAPAIAVELRWRVQLIHGQSSPFRAILCLFNAEKTRESNITSPLFWISAMSGELSCKYCAPGAQGVASPPVRQSELGCLPCSADGMTSHKIFSTIRLS